MMESTFDILDRAFRLAGAASAFFERAREYYYRVMLSGQGCPRCGGALIMIREGQCRCRVCQKTLDPTEVFQRCPACGGKVQRAVRRYACRSCRRDVPSRFLFEGIVFDQAYFKVRMNESRLRRRELRERVRAMLAASRSSPLTPQSGNLAEIPGLLEALNNLTAGLESAVYERSPQAFDLARYQRHIQHHLKPYPIPFDRIPALSENVRRDRVGRFIAVIFLAQARQVQVRQTGEQLMVSPYETNEQRSRIFDETKNTDGCEGPVG
jgi:hypothetical protein